MPPLSFYPGKTDEQLLTGLSVMDPEATMEGMTDEQLEEFGVWLKSFNVRLIARKRSRATTWGLRLTAWLAVNMAIATGVLVNLGSPSGIEPNAFLGWWILTASLVGIVAPIKAKTWQFSLYYSLFVVVLALGVGGF